MVLPIVYYPDPILLQKSEPVEGITDDVITLIRNMEDTVGKYNGAGLAAVQVGSPLRVFLTSETGEKKDIKHYINPVLTVSNYQTHLKHHPKFVHSSHEQNPFQTGKYNLNGTNSDVVETILLEEGCLSIPREWGYVMRPEYISITAQDINGKSFTVHAAGLLSRIIQHEYDHLDGVLFIKRMEASRREKILKSIKKRTKANDYPIPSEA